MVSFTLAEPGTLESDWAEALAGGSVAPLVLDWSRFDRLVVLAAHPDDESLAAGGLISQAHAHHVDIVLIVATRGQNSHPQSPTMTPDQLGDLRIQELRRALACLAHDAVLLEGGFVDGRLADSRSQLAAELNGLCSQDPARVLLVAPWSGDGHADHEVAGDVALQVAASTGCAVLEYPIWLWFWGTPSSGDVPWAALRSLELGVAERGSKALAMAEHRSQVEPLSPSAGDETLLPGHVLDYFRRPFEVFIDSAGRFLPPQRQGTSWVGKRFDLIHAQGAEPWKAPSSWYEQRKRALTLAALPHARFGSALEVGCSTGVLTAELAHRCDKLLGIDISAEAVNTALARTAALPGVRIAQLEVPASWPDEQFDLYVLSETGYYFSRDELSHLLHQMAHSALPGAVVVACHWRHPIDGWPLNGDAVHEALRNDARVTVLSSYAEADFRLDLFAFTDPS